MTDAIVDNAVHFLDGGEGTDNPFFLYLSFTAPHAPIQAPAADIARHRGRYRNGWDALRKSRYERQIALGLLDPSTALSPRDSAVPPWAAAGDHDLQDLKMAIYAAQVDTMDRGVGRVLAKLREIGQEDNTFILFLSDHGACPGDVCADREERLNRPPFLGGPESFAPYGTAWANLSNTPWRKFKTSLREGGISIPMIAVAPGSIAEPGGFCREIGHQIDIMPTILELTGAEYPRQFRGRDVHPWEGVSFAPSLRGERREPRSPLFWEFRGKRAVRDGSWKLVADAEEGPWELYDISRDRSELRNLAHDQPTRVLEMSAQYAAWASRCGVRPWAEMEPLLRDTLH